jgi:hypothetical protein
MGKLWSLVWSCMNGITVSHVLVSYDTKSIQILGLDVTLNFVSKHKECTFFDFTYKACWKKDRTFAMSIKTLLLIVLHFKHCPIQSGLNRAQCYISYASLDSAMHRVCKTCSKKGTNFCYKDFIPHFKHCPLQSSPLYWQYTVPNVWSIVGMLSGTHFLWWCAVLLSHFPESPLCHWSDKQLVHVLSSADVAQLMPIAKRDKWQFVVKTWRLVRLVAAVRSLCWLARYLKRLVSFWTPLLYIYIKLLCVWPAKRWTRHAAPN